MKDKKDILYRNAIVTCWVMLIVCVLLKLFGIPWFEFDKENVGVVEFIRFIKNNTLSLYIASYISLWVNTTLVLLCTVLNLSRRSIVMYSSYLCLSMILDFKIRFVLDTLILLFICLIETKKFKRTLINFLTVVGLNIFYQCVSLYVRDLGIIFSKYSVTDNVFLSIDYYIMLLLTWLYLKKGGVDICSRFHSVMDHTHRCGSSLQKKLCKKHTQNSKQRSTVNREEV